MGAGMWADLVMSGFRPRNIGAIAGKKEAEVLLLHKQARLLAPFVESMLDPRFGDGINVLSLSLGNRRLYIFR